MTAADNMAELQKLRRSKLQWIKRTQLEVAKRRAAGDPTWSPLMDELVREVEQYNALTCGPDKLEML